MAVEVVRSRQRIAAARRIKADALARYMKYSTVLWHALSVQRKKVSPGDASVWHAVNIINVISKRAHHAPALCSLPQIMSR